MPNRLKFASWINGNSVLLEAPLLLVQRYGFGGRITPSSAVEAGWVHFAIPTPVIVDEARLTLESVMLLFSTGATANITSVHVWDGSTRLVTHDGESSHGPEQFKRWMVPSQPLIKWGVTISVYVKFAGSGSDSWVTVNSAGGDFY